MHHSDKPYESELMKEFRDALDPEPRNRHERRAREAELRRDAKREGFGETGRFPDGRLGINDEGEIRFGVAADRGQVVLNFGKPVAWIASPPDDTRALAHSLLEAADKADEWLQSKR